MQGPEVKYLVLVFPSIAFNVSLTVRSLLPVKVVPVNFTLKGNGIVQGLLFVGKQPVQGEFLAENTHAPFTQTESKIQGGILMHDCFSSKGFGPVHPTGVDAAVLYLNPSG